MKIPDLQTYDGAQCSEKIFAIWKKHIPGQNKYTIMPLDTQ